MKTLRTFIAVDFPNEVIEKIASITTYFKTQLPPRSIKWVDPSKLHLTLKFMGETPIGKLDAIKSSINNVSRSYSAFRVEVVDLGMYPNTKQPRVIWLGISGEENLILLKKQLDRSLEAVGFKPESRAFSPHLTIGRVRRSTNKETVEVIGQSLSQFKVKTLGVVHIEKIVYYQSELTPQGPHYTILQSSPLNQV